MHGMATILYPFERKIDTLPHITLPLSGRGGRYKVAPQGFLASRDAYNQRFDAIIADFPNKVKCVDDTCMWVESIETAFLQTCLICVLSQ